MEREPLIPLGIFSKGYKAHGGETNRYVREFTIILSMFLLEKLGGRA